MPLQLISTNILMIQSYKILNSTKLDIDNIQNLYKLATQVQTLKATGGIWPIFKRELIEKEIDKKRQFKLLIDGEVACVWAITFSDPFIWEEKNIDPAIYIHRIATNPHHKGQQLVSKIVEWAKPFAEAHNKKYIRLDTCGNNGPLIKHYQKCGFDFLGIKVLKDTSQLPSHYHDAEVCFFEMAV